MVYCSKLSPMEANCNMKWVIIRCWMPRQVGTFNAKFKITWAWNNGWHQVAREQCFYWRSSGQIQGPSPRWNHHEVYQSMYHMWQEWLLMVRLLVERKQIQEIMTWSKGKDKGKQSKRATPSWGKGPKCSNQEPNKQKSAPGWVNCHFCGKAGHTHSPKGASTSPLRIKCRNIVRAQRCVNWLFPSAMTCSTFWCVGRLRAAHFEEL